ncbi:MAG: hypothetical protein IJW01_00555 [Paludibacteraceae bacterium]|nr:hypothetical protein [Paludibacteraceae bacterium]
MKTNKWLIVVLAVTTLFTACKEDMPTRDDSPLDDPNSIQAYIYDNTSDVLIKPADGGKYLMTIGGEKTTVDAKVFNVLVGRAHAEKADSFQLQVVDESSAFLFDPMVRFDKGSVVDTIAVEVLLDFGESASLTLTVPEEYASSYSASSKTINVNVDYTWLPRGKGTFISAWEAAEGVVAIEKAKEFNNTAGDSLYRLVSPYFVVAPDFCSEEGKHLTFLLHSDYSAYRLPTGIQLVEDDPWSIYWALPEEPFGTYCSFTNNDNVYEIGVVWYQDYSPYNFSTEIFVWTDGYPGELTDPAEGEGALDELTFTSGTLATDADAVEDGDEVHNLYTLKLTNGGVKLNLELIGDEVVGTYTIESDPVAAGKAVAGYYDGAQKNGCYLDLSVTKYYLTSGEITIAEDAENPGTYTVNVTAKSATDVDVVASFTGELPAPSPAPGKPKTLKRINL